MTGRPLASVIIPAHNEAAVLERCLKALFTGVPAGALDVIVVCNGCRDDSATVARGLPYPVRVIELDVASKAAALRTGDDAARVHPRLYLDADVVLAGASALAVIDRLRHGAIAARPPIQYDSRRSSSLVRGYYRARARIPAVMNSLWGAGVYGLSAEGRSRFERFPDFKADDLWIDRQYRREEIEIVDCEPVRVAVPRRPRDLIHVLRRTYRGKSETGPERGRDAYTDATTASTLRDLRALASAGPVPAIDAVIYAAFAASGRLALRATRGPRDGIVVNGWERDDSSRVYV